MCVALFAALATSIVVPADKQYLTYFDWKTLSCLFCVLAVVCALKNVRFFCLRVVSDTPGGADNIAQYENFWDDAPSHTLSLISKVLSSI